MNVILADRYCRRMVRLSILLAGFAICAVATFAAWKSLFGAVFTEAIGIALLVIAFRMKRTAR
jgi:hypothetical protein